MGEAAGESNKRDGLAAIILVPAAIFGVGLVIAGLLFSQFITSLSDEEVRFLAPGEKALQVEASERYHVWYYTTATFEGKIYKPPPSAEGEAVVTVTDGDGLRPLTLGSSNANKSAWGERADSIGTFVSDSSSEVNVGVRTPDGVQAVVGIGRLDIGKMVGFIVGAVIATLASFFLAAVVAIVLTVRRRQRRRASQAEGAG